MSQTHIQFQARGTVAKQVMFMPSSSHRFIHTCSHSFQQQQHINNDEESTTPHVEMGVLMEDAKHNTTVVGSIEQYMGAKFTCGKCSTESSHIFTKNSYKNEIVIVRCPGCSSLHLFADNKGWFGSEKNVEEILTNMGKSYKRVTDASEMTAEEEEQAKIFEQMVTKRNERKQQ